MTIRRSVQSAAGWTFRWGLEVLIAVVIAGLVAAMLFGSAGCQLKEPIDTDGDGRPDTSMTADQIDLWQKRDEAKVKAAVEKAKADAEARIAQQKAALEEAKRIKRDAEREIRKAHARAESDSEEIAADAEDQIAALQAQVDLAIQNIQADATASIAKLAEDLQIRNDSRAAALASIDAKAGFFDAIISNPTVQSAANSVPFGGAALGLLTTLGGLVLGHRSGKSAGSHAGETKGWDDGYAAGVEAGKQTGLAQGRDIGWQERAEHQAEIDKTYEEALNRAGKVAA